MTPKKTIKNKKKNKNKNKKQQGSKLSKRQKYIKQRIKNSRVFAGSKQRP